MKNFKFTPTSIILLVALLLSNSMFSQNTVTPTSGAQWLGYVNAFSISDGEFQFGAVYQVEQFTDTSLHEIILPTGDKEIQLIEGLISKPSTIIGTFLTGIYVNANRFRKINEINIDRFNITDFLKSYEIRE